MTTATQYAANARERVKNTAQAVAERVRAAARRRASRRSRGAWHGEPEAASSPANSRGPATSNREQERKFDVTAAFELPSFEEETGLTVLDDEELELVAVYYDTPDLRLTRSGVSLRYRNDEGWTVKLPEDAVANGLARRENHFTGDPSVLPIEAANLVTGWTRQESLRPVAKLETRRHRIELGDNGANPIAEVADDRVRATTQSTDAELFRQIEIELLSESAGKLQKRIVSQVRAAGAKQESGVPKIQRALGAAASVPSDLDAAMPKKPVTVRDIVQSAVVASARRLVDHDAAVRLGEDPEAVHQARVATRRLRSDLKTFRPVLERATTDPLRDELRWLGTRLGGVRDADVLGELLRTRLETLERAESGAAKFLWDRLESQRAQARATLDIAMTSGRYKQLLERLVELGQAPPVTDEAADRKARKALPGLVRRPWLRLRESVKAMSANPSDADLHEARKRAKEARYAAEAAAPVMKKPAKLLAKAMQRVQDHLGSHQDAVVARAWLEHAALSTDDRDAILLAGELAGLCAGQRDRLHRQWPTQWRKARRQKYRDWLSVT
jgi:CHAD domain-containing protein